MYVYAAVFLGCGGRYESYVALSFTSTFIMHAVCVRRAAGCRPGVRNVIVRIDDEAIAIATIATQRSNF